MPVHLTIHDAPDELIARVKHQAQRHRRSLQGEVLAILEEAVPSQAPELSIEDLTQAVRALGLTGPSEAAELIRADRNAR
ncbi:FitA-like ribbon-helix-helix domain-containing protein [Niveispirillum sp. KHB5.9]|uniref:FitA-like ribbon-helix-helix domain-containing protein n=1 Tax=Niveispirillum sp. KHB5.9 TaxID=3400269 RepID=UPI003A87EC71